MQAPTEHVAPLVLPLKEVAHEFYKHLECSQNFKKSFLKKFKESSGLSISNLI